MIDTTSGRTIHAVMSWRRFLGMDTKHDPPRWASPKCDARTGGDTADPDKQPWEDTTNQDRGPDFT